MPHPLAHRWIRETEEKLGAKLPLVYAESMMADNGGCIEIDDYGWFLFPIRDASNRKRLASTIHDILYETMELQELPHFPPDAVAIASDGGGNALLFRVVGGVIGPDVWDWDHETGAVVRVANFADVVPVPAQIVRTPRKKVPPAASTLVFGDRQLDPIPKPWRCHSQVPPFELTFGKKSSDFQVTMHDGPPPVGVDGSDSAWVAAWLASLDFALDAADCMVTRESLVEPIGLLITVASEQWTPVRMWWCPQDGSRTWHASVRTEQSRAAGDRRELMKLLSHARAV